MKRTMIVIVLFLGLFALWGCNNSPETIIEISNDSFSNYPAVWFSPSTGEIVAVESEVPPDDKYVYWIEPRDPEFSSLSYSDNNSYGIKFVGIGSEYFNETTSSQKSGFSSDLFDVGTFDTDSVFFIRTDNVSCLIQIVDWQPAKNYLKFKWKKLP